MTSLIRRRNSFILPIQIPVITEIQQQDTSIKCCTTCQKLFICCYMCSSRNSCYICLGLPCPTEYH